MSWFENNIKKTYFIIVFIILMFFIILELSLKFYHESKLWTKLNKYGTMFRVPNMNLILNMEKLYPADKLILFRTNEYREVVSGKEINKSKKDAYFFGGSTTESYAVQEGKRWVDLIHNYNTHNYGVSGADMADSYYNLKTLINKNIILNGSTIFIMHGCNDVREILGAIKYGFKPLDIDKKWLNYLGAYEKNKPKTILWYIGLYFNNFLKSKIHILSTLDSYIKKYCPNKNKTTDKDFYNNLYESYLKQTKENNKGAFLTKEEMKELLLKIEFYLPLREKLLLKINELCKKNKLELILLTQANAWVREYRIDNGIYAFPIYKDKNTTRKQTWLIHNIINKQTINFAKKYKLKYVDTARFFLRYDANQLFYDQVHMTDKGCFLFAKIINSKLKQL